MLDAHTLAPTPDFYSSLLWKRLVGRRVLQAQLAADTRTKLAVERDNIGNVPPGLDRVVRVYAHCAAVVSDGDSASQSGAIVLVVVNPQERAMDLDLAWAGASSSSSRHEYLFTSGDGTLGSRTVRLNGGAPLQLQR